MLTRLVPIIIAIASCVGDLTPPANAAGNWRVTVHSPTVSTGDFPEITVDGGNFWDNVRDTVIGPQQSTGLRISEAGPNITKTNNSPVFIKNTLPYELTYWLQWYTPDPPYNFGLYTNNADVYVDYSKKPQQTIVPGQPIPVVVSADFDITKPKGDYCPKDVWSIKVFYNNGTSPTVIKLQTPPEGDEVFFHVDDLSHVANVTTSLGAVIFPGLPNPIVAQYKSVDLAPLVTAHIQAAGGFCDWDD